MVTAALIAGIWALDMSVYVGPTWNRPQTSDSAPEGNTQPEVKSIPARVPEQITEYEMSEVWFRADSSFKYSRRTFLDGDTGTLYTYLETHDVDAYLREIDTCCEMPGVKSFMLSGIPAKDYMMILKIQTLREAGRKEEALALLEAAQQSMKGEKAQLLLREEEEKLGGQP